MKNTNKTPAPYNALTLRTRSYTFARLQDFPQNLRGTVQDIIEAMAEDEDWFTDGVFLQPDAIQCACEDPELGMPETATRKNIKAVIAMLRANRCWLLVVRA